MKSYQHCHIPHLEFGVVLAEITVSTESPLVYRQVCWTLDYYVQIWRVMDDLYIEEFVTSSRTIHGKFTLDSL